MSMNIDFKVRPLILILLLLCASISQSNAQLEPRSLSSFADKSRSQFQPLPLEEAFPFYVSELGDDRYQVTWNIAQDHYLYKRAFNFSLRQSKDAEALATHFELPEGIEKSDEFFGDVEVYYLELSTEITLPSKPNNAAYLVIEYQGCAEWGFCYPPQEHFFKLM